jgi:hypothetical protein
MFPKKICLLLTILLVSTTNSLFSQAHRSLFLELGGNGIAISLNYDARFKKQENGFGYRVGIGVLPATVQFFTETSTILTIPVGINHLTGKKSHHFETGLGATFITGSVGFWGEEKENVTGVVFLPSIGYRYSRTGGGFQGRVVISPLVGGGGASFYYGLSGGFAF